MTAQGDKKRSVFSIPFFVIRFKQKGRSGTSALLARRCASVSPVDVNCCLYLMSHLLCMSARDEQGLLVLAR